ncbi:MAG: response regulator [Oscillospiraceae bacterium]|nr:response regulator [Oscillospiraceae bacterium]
MYHCHVQIYLAGSSCEAFETVKGMPPLEHFSHSFLESAGLDEGLAAQADLILADLGAAGDAAALLACKRPEAECILLAGREEISHLVVLPGVSDIWTLPLEVEEVRFRFLRWQQAKKIQTDAWEIGHFHETIINSVPNLVWYKDKNGVHEKVNDSFCRTVNKPKHKVEGRRHAYIWDVEEDDPVCIESERIVMESGKTQVSEETVKTGEGTRLLTTYKSPLYNLDGSVMGTVGVAIDVTQERAYEQEIIEKNHTLETIFTTMDCGVMRHTLDGVHILSINRAALKILGYETQEELLQDGFAMVANSVVEEDKVKLRESIVGLKKAGDSVSIEYRVQHKDGERLHVMGNVKLVQEGGELFYQRFLLDITAQKLMAERERAESERRQMELVQALSTDYSLACFFDLDTGMGFPLRMDDADRLNSVFGREMSYQESMERYIELFVYVEDREMLREVSTRETLRQELAEKNIFYVNYRACIQGEMRYYQMKAVRAGKWEEHRGIVLGFRSVDEETRREMEKKTLLEDALLQAKRASKAKSVFLSNMSHDIRTPMNAIVGFTSLAISHIDRREQVEEYLKKIMTSGNHLLSLINDILDMSRIESGKLHLDEELCSLPEILHGLRSIVQADVHAKQLDLQIDTVDVLDEEIYCDRLRLNQVLLNLLSNAIKYTGAGGRIGVRIIEKSGVEADWAYYEFRIRDTGIGMSAEFVKHIFEPFERERNSTISGIQGTGLGMAITKNIVDMMHGTIEVTSEQGVGSEFSACFPFRLHSEPKEVRGISELKDCRALVVDDDFNTCDSVSYMLQQIGLRAEWTMSGKEAVLRSRQAVARNDNYDVYILDWLIPDMNGVEVARRIRREAGESVPIIVLTAYDWTDIEDEAREAGVTAFCSKPLFLSELRSCLSSIVGAEEAKPAPVKKRKKQRTGRILLAEDNELNQEIAIALLEEAGFTAEVAANGKIAVEMLARSEPGYYRLVLMDVQMPVMGGYEATKVIRAMKNKKLASIPILAMTANAFEEDKQEALKSGMNDHVTKPIDVDMLMETMDRVLD